MYSGGNYYNPPFNSTNEQYAYLDQYELNRQQQLLQLFNLPQWRQLQRRVEQLERQNVQQDREIDRLRNRLQRVNQRLRTVERRLNIIIAYEEGF